MTRTISFEQPLNERIRTFLRIEQLIQRFEYCAAGQTPWDTHFALLTLLEVNDLAARGDLKSELMKELKRQTANMEAVSESPGVDRTHLESITAKHRELIDNLYGLSGQLGSQLKHNEFINSIKQRTAIPGGTCDFDLPAYHFWLSKPPSERHAALTSWVKPFAQIHEAVIMILKLIRESAKPQQIKAAHGFYQQNLQSAQPFQMIRILLPEDSPYYPEISAGKHRFSVRFRQPKTLEARASQANQDVEFELSCCAL